MNDPPRGFVLAATGNRYTIMARRAARSLRAVAPDAVIDLFTDQKLSDPVFARIHSLDASGPRPKMEAIRRSRFDRTIYLDSDVVAIEDPGDVFTVLDRFDFAAAHVNTRASENALTVLGTPLPNAFPAMNSGVIACRNTAAVRTLMADCERMMADRKLEIDQPVLRELLWRSDLRIATLPVEYNLMAYELLSGMRKGQTAPRLLHLRNIHLRDAPPGDPETPFDLEVLMPKFHRDRIAQLRSADRTLGGTADPALVFARPATLPVRLGRRLPHSVRAVLRAILTRP